MLALVNLILVSQIGSAAADEPCTSDPENFWLCEGEPAWDDGYLVDSVRLLKLLNTEELYPKVVEQRDKAVEQRDVFRDLMEKYANQRDEYKLLRDSLQDLLDVSIQLQEDYRSQRENMEAELEIVEQKYLDEARRAAKMEAQYENAWSDWEVGLFSGGIGVVGILVGVGVTALAYELR